MAEAQAKRARKRVDLVVANDVSAVGSGFGTDTNRVWLVGEAVEALPLLPKAEVAARLVEWLADHLEGS